MSLSAQIIDQRVSGIVSEQEDAFTHELMAGNDVHKRRSLAFLFLVSKTMFELTDEDTLDSIVDGGNDFGIDAIWFESPDQGEIKVALIQAKYRTNLEGTSSFPEDGIIKLIGAIDALFDPSVPVAINDRLRRRVEDVRSFIVDGAIPRVTAIAANNGLIWSHESEQRIKNASKGYANLVEWCHIGADEFVSMLQARKPISADIQLIGKASVEAFDFRRVLVGRMSVSQLATLAEQYDNRLFERNICRYLGLVGNRVNEAVAYTLKQADQRSNFYFYNNGITITCSKFRHNELQRENWRVQIDDLQIVNGGQTARTVQNVAKEMGPSIDTAEVLVRIYEIEENDVDLIEAITFATNSQNPVDLRDLKANDPKQKILSESVTALGYLYRAKREDSAIAPNEFTSAVVAEAVLAIWRHRPHQARFSSREHFGALYDHIFTKLNGAQAIIAALLHRHAENRRKRPPENAPDFLPYGSRFIAMLMGRYLLSDLNISVDKLDHRNFLQARELVDSKYLDYILKAEAEIGNALAPLFNGRERTLQRLSATFRRSDLVDML